MSDWQADYYTGLVVIATVGIGFMTMMRELWQYLAMSVMIIAAVAFNLLLYGRHINEAKADFGLIYRGQRIKD